jgi:hypothetical protein
LVALSLPKICDGAVLPSTRFSALAFFTAMSKVTLLLLPMSKLCHW